MVCTTNHLAEQMRALGWATVSVGEAAAERIEQLEARVIELETRFAALDRDAARDIHTRARCDMSLEIDYVPVDA